MKPTLFRTYALCAAALLTWPGEYTGWALDTASAVNASMVWNQVTNAVSLSNGSNQITHPLNANQRFYRLRKNGFCAGPY